MKKVESRERDNLDDLDEIISIIIIFQKLDIIKENFSFIINYKNDIKKIS